MKGDDRGDLASQIKYRILELTNALYKTNPCYVSTVRIDDHIYRMLTDVQFFREATIQCKMSIEEGQFVVEKISR